MSQSNRGPVRTARSGPETSASVTRINSLESSSPRFTVLVSLAAWPLGMSTVYGVPALICGAFFLAEAHGLLGLRVTRREQIPEIYAAAQADPGTVVIDFRVEQEDSVYPMVAAGADLADMIRRPNALVETGEDP